MDKLDKKDYEILRLLDKNFRMSFSQIAKKVKLSKNSVALRFKKLEKYLLHNTTGINYELLGYSMVKVFYTLDLYKEDFEKLIINEVKKHPSILWAARFYGKYNLCICLLVNDMNVLIEHIDKFNHKFSKKINEKEIEIVSNQIYLRNNFLYENPAMKRILIPKSQKVFSLSEIDKKVLCILRLDPELMLWILPGKLVLFLRQLRIG